jgi:hypothetical protein
VTAMTLPGGTSAGICPEAEAQDHYEAGQGHHDEGQAVPDFSRWPLRSHLILGALPSAVPCARLHAVHVLHEWGLRNLADDTGLIVSEIVTNGVRASADLVGSRYAGRWAPGRPPVRLWLHGHQERIAIRVWDASDRLPARQPADPGAEGGRGLLLVEALSDAWGCCRPPRPGGKVVWATLH